MCSLPTINFFSICNKLREYILTKITREIAPDIIKYTRLHYINSGISEIPARLCRLSHKADNLAFCIKFGNAALRRIGSAKKGVLQLVANILEL